MKILILSNNDLGLYRFRKELIKELICNGNEVFAAIPYGKYIVKLEELGCKCVISDFARHSINPFSNILLIIKYFIIIKKLKPDVVLTYTAKPNIYGGIITTVLKIPLIANITGLGIHISRNDILGKIITKMYRISMKYAKAIFFQNKDNYNYFLLNDFSSDVLKIIPGSGVNLSEYKYSDYQRFEKFNDTFLFAGRIMVDKGINELLSAAKLIKAKYPKVTFNLIGFNDGYKGKIDKNIVNLFDSQLDLKPYYEKCSALVMPSYHEGMSNVCLEAAASGRPIIASDIPGCKETFDDGATGISFIPKDVDSLYNALDKFINLSWEDKKRMGIDGRRKVEKEFDRNIVINAYMKELENIV